MHVGSKIKAARISKGLTQEELGNLVGVQKSAIAKYESGRVVNIKRSTLQKLSEILGLRPSELFFEDEQKNNDIINNAVVRMRTDERFSSLIQSILYMDQEKLSSLSGFSELRSLFETLNQNGKQRLLSLAHDLTQIPLYTDELSIAAHPAGDVSRTLSPEGKLEIKSLEDDPGAPKSKP